jgi:hypothetical protein
VIATNGRHLPFADGVCDAIISADVMRGREHEASGDDPQVRAVATAVPTIADHEKDPTATVRAALGEPSPHPPERRDEIAVKLSTTGSSPS